MSAAGSPGASAPPAPPVLEDRRPGPGRLAGFVLLLLGVAAGLATFSALPWAATPPGVALLKVALKHVSTFAHAGDALSREELEKLPRHMRPQAGQSGASAPRRDTIVRVILDGRVVLDKTYRPSGFRGDGPTLVYEELDLPPGPHRLEATLGEVGAPPGGKDAPTPARPLAAEISIGPGQVLLLELSGAGELILRGGGPAGVPGQR